MFSPRCANPECGAAFNYRRGRLFRFHESRGKEWTDTATPVPVHFWLCEHCCHQFTILYVDGKPRLTRMAVKEWIGGSEKRRVKNA